MARGSYDIIAACEKRFDDTGTDALRGFRDDHCLPIKLHIGR